MKLVKQSFEFYNGVLIYPFLIVLLIWSVMWVEVNFHLDFTSYGVYPRRASGLQGILWSSFIHSGPQHLMNNTVPIFVLTMALFYFYRNISWKVLLWTIILSGVGTWLIGRPAYHIGISGVIYGLVSFLFFKGVLTKNRRLVALSLVVVFLYGSLIWGTLPIKEGVSWEGHLSGLVVGLLLALRFRESVQEPPKYVWEKENYKEEEDPFMQCFDENGNFIESSAPDEEVETEIIYHFRATDEEE